MRRAQAASSLAGGSDATDVVDLVLEHQTCLRCLTRTSGQTAERISDVLTHVLRRFTLHVFDGVCDGCGQATVVHRLDSGGIAAA